ncbi:MAG: DUF1593 domain-containing protein [Flammeovirgaceae bacterium]|nr:DUF1593 domain-containing protein [Flammeovirgaceae bacterium]
MNLKRIIWMALAILFLAEIAIAQIVESTQRHRVLVLTDIENEPDDAESLVRFLVYSNHYDVEGLVATTSTHLRDKIADWRIHEIVDAYGKVRDNLEKHEQGFPTHQFLKDRIKKGIPVYGLKGVGEGQDSEGSDWLIDVVDKNDDRPVWISIWGGANVLAQSLWKVRQNRTKAELDQFVSKIRVYTISDQDDSGFWMRKEFPNLFYIVSPGDNYRTATWSGISGEPQYGFASGADTTLVQNPWLRENIMENHGPLGAEYPEVEYAMEGDTPSFLALINNGLNVAEKPDFGGWGGRYELYKPRLLPYRELEGKKQEPRPIWTDAMDEVVGNDGKIYIDNHASIWRWREAFQHDFAARIDWTIMDYKEANHPPVPKIKELVNFKVKAGSSISIDASESTDPDGNKLSYTWIHYPEPGNYHNVDWKPLKFEGKKTSNLKMIVPDYVKIKTPQTTHIILEVTDNGSPSLTRYKRIIVTIVP